VQPRYIARVALLLALTVVGSIIVRLLTERDTRRESDRRAEVAAVQVHGRITQAASLTESLRRFMLDARTTGVTSNQFAKNALRWLGPAHFSAAAWVERVPHSRRSAYERRIGQAIVTPDARYGVVRAGSRSSYLPATLATGFPPMAARGIDLSSAPGMTAALGRATRLRGVVATPIASLRTGTRGLVLVAPAPNLIGRVLRPGYVAVFVSDVGLRAAATGVPAVQVRAAGGSAQAHGGGETSTTSFTTAGQRFTVVVPREPVQGAAAVLPWVILIGGLLVVALGAALTLNAARRARAQEELDRVFNLSQDLIAVADFEGRFRRVNPAAEEILGYTEEELLARPFIELVHPADRDRTVAEADAIARGTPTVSFENRYVCKDGSVRVLDWTATPDVENGLMYAVARDVTERRETEAEVERLAGEQAALRRAATLVAEEAPAADVFAKVAEEAATVLGDAECALLRDEGDGTATVVGLCGRRAAELWGTRLPIEGRAAAMVAIREARPGRVDDYSAITGDLGRRGAELGLRSAVACPIVVRGRVWGAIGVFRYQDAEPFAADAEERLAQFADLVATAIANADTRDQLIASRARLVTEGDEARRRVVRDLHDGAQQRLVHTVITLKLAKRAMRENGDNAESLVAEALEQAERGNAELRELAHGLLPATLTRGGLRAGVDAVVARLDLPVETDLPAERLPAEIEASAYFIVAEALTNVVKHAHATRAEVKASLEDGTLRVEVHDDGVGGANADGRGLLGLHDRATALGGRLEIESPDRGGTMVTARLPLRVIARPD
jgi:PAS domain S-box-containing protein